MRTTALAGLMMMVAACGGDDDGGSGGDIDGGAGAEDAAALDAAAPDAGPAPDLVLVAARAEESLIIDQVEIDEASCALAEGCVDGIGTRTVVRFDSVVTNQGNAPLDLGMPGENDDFVYSECHDHYHLPGFLRYELIDGDDVTVAQTSYMAFCVQDAEQASGDVPVTYDCQTQGISVGWASTFDSELPCQWIDITDIAPGDYTLRVETNVERTVPESDFDNNSIDVPVTIPE